VSASGPVTVRELLAVLRRWQVRVLAGETGLSHPVSWASTMRARLPAFEGFSGGELALLALPVLRALRSQVDSLTLPGVVQQLGAIGVAAILVGGVPEDAADPALSPIDATALREASVRADDLGVPLLAVPITALTEVEHDIVSHLIARRERHPRAAEPSPADAARLRASLRTEALDALLTGTYAGESAMRARAAQLGYDLARPHAVLWVDLAPHDPAASGVLGLPTAHPAAARLADELTNGIGAWARARGPHVTALLALDRPVPNTKGDTLDRVKALLTRILGDGSASGDAAWIAGMGEPATSPAQVHRSSTEARDAARLGYALLGPRRVVRPADLGIYRLLLALRDAGELAPFVQRTLDPLLADTRNGDALVDTLDAFFACNGNLSEAARRLHLHRNSLIYRLNRARELLGRDLDDADLRLALQLAIKGRRVLDV
jgi:sugar diacid utilization regulator